VEGSVRGSSQPSLSTFPVGGKPERPEKTHDFRQSVDWLFLHSLFTCLEFGTIIEATISELSERRFSCDDYANEAPWVESKKNQIYIHQSQHIRKRSDLEGSWTHL
jgi:hypothetical protein